MSTFDRILTSTPINGTAARVVAQGHATDEGSLTRDELVTLLRRVERKHRLLKHVLGIRNASQHRNAIYKATHGLPQYRRKAEPRAFTEYLRVGEQIQRLVRRLAELKAEHEATRPSRAEHDAAWNAMSPEQQAAVRQAAYERKIAARLQRERESS